MKKINLYGLDQTIYYEKLKNGLQIYMVPFENKNNYAMHYVTKFGSLDTTFIPYNSKKEVTVPDGIAHFLEHKMFESEDGVDPFSFAAKSGTDCNASTSYKYTRYLFEGSNAFKENLDYLLTYVNSPYFTDENVEKEKGIIIEELLQYQDMIDARLDNIIKENVFINDPMRIDVGGTIDSVKSITKEQLYDIYYTFYQPSNMFLIITGKFDIEEALDVIKNNEALKNTKSNFKISKKVSEEPNEVKERYVDVKLNTKTTKCAYTVKIPIDKKNKLEQFLYFSVFLNMAFGATSEFREEMKKKDMYNNFYYFRDITNDYFILSFISDTDKPNELIENIKRTIDNFKPNEERLERIKKTWIASEVRMTDNINSVLENIFDDIIEYGEIIDNRVEIYRGLNIEKLNYYFNNTDFGNTSTVIVKPNE